MEVFHSVLSPLDNVHWLATDFFGPILATRLNYRFFYPLSFSESREQEGNDGEAAAERKKNMKKGIFR